MLISGFGKRKRALAMEFPKNWFLFGILLILVQAETCFSSDHSDSGVLEQSLSLEILNKSPETYKETSENVLVELYSESLCPFCANFIVNYLSHFFDNGLIEIVDIRIIPFGNAHINSDGSITCQGRRQEHGPDECKLNIIQTCAINLWPNVTQWFPFILCLESLPRHTAAQQWTSCVKSSNLELSRIAECYEGPLGDKLERRFADETFSLKPPHQYVPWVLVNGTPLYDDYESVETYVCQVYKGPKPLPAICNSIMDIFPLRLKNVRPKGQNMSKRIFS
ncbi:hypothetical protein O6H91_14G036000 [Diphasiastrum complanatum]|uniref:Uncharacterized protein n=1 Tax=Diphasiastrum complanatum TaxID=34168 RepID=A0ACC2BN34_DIPCM|nr:hypothetical protein O6H91_14G036000 [Diphasiastrum complanatum]